MTFQDFAAEWFRQVTANGDSVSQDAIDMAEQAWELATKAEREACAKVCDTRRIAAEAVDGKWDQGYNMATRDIAGAIRAR